ncbi:hypothetical protein EJ04DRAFT_513552 [Polyplosphaeria fusca]|uniref:Cupin type-1 domain-containing protein n=1 Tax=Polyplosphaeria fusca TaxID=682080 RepID=A0A9P4QWY1_9PLEO|nr:hypothetical protein EJ04DRAFT_513552 [Polyplosphaeria fusca]
MVQVKTYALPPTDLIPNSPHVLIHYPRLLEDLVKSPSFTPSAIYDTFARNGWYSQWIARYGPDQASHYHSAAHECMAVISGEGATIRFGVADASSDADGHENGGVEVQASLGDVFVLPAGVAHKTFRPRPDSIGLDFMAPEDENGKLVASPTEARAYFEQVKMTGAFMMMGAYPKGYEWDFMVGGEHKGRFPEVWNVSVPEADPVLGVDPEGLRGLWSNSAKKE